MRITLNDFFYFVRMMGKDDDGLSSLTCKYRVIRGRRDGVADIKAAVDAFVKRHEAVLDPLFEALFEGEKTPTLRDSPDRTRVGYRYVGHLTEDGMRVRPERLERLFGVVDPQSVYSQYRQQQVDIQCDVPTTQAGLDNVVVEVSYELDHGLNVCAFRFLQGLEDIEPAAPARDAIAKLDATLGETAARGRDHYRSLIGEDA